MRDQGFDWEKDCTSNRFLTGGTNRILTGGHVTHISTKFSCRAENSSSSTRRRRSSRASQLDSVAGGTTKTGKISFGQKRGRSASVGGKKTETSRGSKKSGTSKSPSLEQWREPWELIRAFRRSARERRRNTRPIPVPYCNDFLGKRVVRLVRTLSQRDLPKKPITSLPFYEPPYPISPSHHLLTKKRAPNHFRNLSTRKFRNACNESGHRAL